MKSPKTVLVTGANGALGHSVVEKFLQSGCKVIGTTLLPPGKDERGDVTWVQMDLANAQSVHKGLSTAGPIDALVHCAGGFRYLTAEQTGDEDLAFLMDANLRSAFLLVREILPGMKERGFGRIIFISAKATLQPSAGMGAYAASKAGLNMLTASLAEEVRAHDINVNAVLPSIIDTKANRKDMPQADFSKWVTPEALAEIIFSLTQPWGKPIHGALIPVTGRV